MAARRHAFGYDVLLAASMLAGIFGIFKGITPVDRDAEFYWRFSYEHGFIKRGLMGTIVKPLVTRVPFEQLTPMIVGAHVIVCVSILAMFLGLFRSAVRAERRTDSRLALMLALLCLSCSEMMPVLAHDTGSIDVYVIALALVGCSFVLQARYGIAVCLGIAGPLIHEGFVFVWAPLGILLVWSSVSSEGQRFEKIAAAAAPVVSALLVNRAHNPAAVAQLMSAWDVSGDIKSGHMAYTFGQTLQSSFQHMRDYEFRGHWRNLATTVSYFLVPHGLLLWTAAFCYSRRWALPWTTFLIAFGAVLSPLAILAFAWDLSRFLVWSTVGAGIVLLGVGSGTLIDMRAEDA